MRRGLSLAEYLIHPCAGPTGDRRLVMALGRDAFSAALCVLLQQVGVLCECSIVAYCYLPSPITTGRRSL